MYVGKYVGLSRKTHTKNMYAKIRTYVAQTRDVQSQFWVVKTDLWHPYYIYFNYTLEQL